MTDGIIPSYFVGIYPHTITEQHHHTVSMKFRGVGTLYLPPVGTLGLFRGLIVPSSSAFIAGNTFCYA